MAWPLAERLGAIAQPLLPAGSRGNAVASGGKRLTISAGAA